MQSLAIVAQAQPVGGAPTWQESRVALGFAPQKRLVAHSFKFADYSFFDKLVTHDNLFHSVLALAGVETSLYQRKLDAYAPCSLG